MATSFLSRIYLLIVTITVVVYYSINISPDLHWIWAFVPLLIPVFILVNLLFFFYWVLRRKLWLILASLIILGFGFKYIIRTYNFNFSDQKEGEIKLLNYNVRIFNSYKHLRHLGSSPEKLIKWAVNNEADIKCFQEFYHYPEFDTFNVIPRFKKNTPYYFFKPASIIRKQYFGQAIFSKYPIIKKGYVSFENASFNQAIFADVVVKRDTIRVYNIHLQSMSINEQKISTTYSKSTYDNLKDLFRRIKKGALQRSKQTQALIEHIKLCPYKIIVSGDLNDTPYSYTYEALREELCNGFEEEGEGFGFSYNGKLFFIRIDNIFSDERIKVKTFKTRRDIKYTDHFPIEATYMF